MPPRGVTWAKPFGNTDPNSNFHFHSDIYANTRCERHANIESNIDPDCHGKCECDADAQTNSYSEIPCDTEAATKSAAKARCKVSGNR